MDNQQENLTLLEELLVREFRLCQSIFLFLKEERALLLNEDFRHLNKLIEKTEFQLDEMNKIVGKCRMVVTQLSKNIGLQTQSPRLTDILNELEDDIRDRLRHLYEGIITLVRNIRNLIQLNKSFVIKGSERVDILQTNILDLFQIIINRGLEKSHNIDETSIASANNL